MAAPRSGKDLLEPRFLALLAAHDVEPATIDIFGNSKVKTATRGSLPAGWQTLKDDTTGRSYFVDPAGKPARTT